MAEANQLTSDGSLGIAPRQTTIGRLLAQLVSVVLHPLFIPIYVIAFFIYLHPTYFVGFSAVEKQKTLLMCFINLVAFPLLAVVLLKALGFISSIYLHTTKDRIIPYIAAGIFFFWGYTIFRNQEAYPKILAMFIFGIFFASSAALIANIYLKVSMHAIGVGGLLGIFLLLWSSSTMLMTWPLALACILAGLVCSVRLYLGAHKNIEIWLGLLIGLASQFVAYFIVGM